MAQGYYNVTFPNRPIVLDGGLNTKFEKSIIPDADSADCLNVVFTNRAVEVRGGSTKLNTASVGSFVADGLYTRRGDDGSETMVAFFGGLMRTWTGSTFTTISSAQSVFTQGVRVAAAQYQNYMFFGNGNAIPHKYDGTYFTRHGVYPLSNTASFVTVGTAGSLTSQSWSYKFVAVNSAAVLSDVSSAASVAVSALGRVHISSIPVSPQSHGVSSRRIYRTQSGTTYFLLATINDNTTTTYEDDGSITLGAEAPTDNGVPPNFSVCVYHADRLWVNDPTNPNYVWYSDLGEPFTFQSDSFFKVGDASSDLVKGFEVYENSVVVLCENSKVLNYMASTDPTDWRQVRIRSSYGSKSPFGTFKFNNRVFVPLMQNTKFVGFGAITGDTLDPSATLLTVSTAGSDLLSDKIEPNIFDVQETYVPNISSMAFRNQGYIAVTSGSGNTQNNRVFLFDFSFSNLNRSQNFAWSLLSGLNAAQFTIYDGKLYIGSSLADGFVHQLETTSYNDNSSAINAYFWTKEFSGLDGHENLIKDFRKIKFLADLPGNYYMTLTWKTDSDSGVGQTKNVLLDPGGSVWGTMRWGIDTWGAGKNQYEFEISLGQTSGKRIQFKFDNQNTANQFFKIHRMSFSYNIRGIE